MRRPGIANGEMSAKALAFIRAEVAAGNQMPTARSIEKHMGYTSNCGRDIFERLRYRGYLRMVRHDGPLHLRYELTHP